MAWDKTKCAEGILAPLLNDEIRENWDALEAALTKEHHFSTGELASLQGLLRQGSARCFFQGTSPTTRVDGSAFASTDLGSLWIDSDSGPVNQLNILTATTPTWTPVSTEIIAALLKVARTFAEVITFSKSPVFTLGIVANNSYLQGRNAAGAANVDLIKVARNEADDADVPQIPNAARLASNAAPTEDTQLANKKYVDTKEDTLVTQATAGIFGAYTIQDTTPANFARDEIYKAQCDGFVGAVGESVGSGDWTVTFEILVAAITPPGTARFKLEHRLSGAGRAFTPSGIVPIRKDEYFKIRHYHGETDYAIDLYYWIPIGTGGCVKQ